MTLKTLVLIQPPKLSNAESGQYLGDCLGIPVALSISISKNKGKWKTE